MPSFFHFKLFEFDRRFDFGDHTGRTLVKEEVVQLHVPLFDVFGSLGSLGVLALPLPDINLVCIWTGVYTTVITAAATAAAVAAGADADATVVVAISVTIIVLFVGCGTAIFIFGGLWYFCSRHWYFLTRDR